MKKLIYLIIYSLLLFVLGFVNYNDIQNFILQKSSFTYVNMNTQFFDSLKFAILCGITPFIFNKIWNKTKNLKLKLLSVFIFLLSIATYVFIITFMSNSNSTIEKVQIDNSSNVDSLNLPLHFLLAQIIGFVIIYLVLKNRIKTE